MGYLLVLLLLGCAGCRVVHNEVHGNIYGSQTGSLAADKEIGAIAPDIQVAP